MKPKKTGRPKKIKWDAEHFEKLALIEKAQTYGINTDDPNDAVPLWARVAYAERKEVEAIVEKEAQANQALIDFTNETEAEYEKSPEYREKKSLEKVMKLPRYEKIALYQLCRSTIDTWGTNDAEFDARWQQIGKPYGFSDIELYDIWAKRHDWRVLDKSGLYDLGQWQELQNVLNKGLHSAHDISEQFDVSIKHARRLIKNHRIFDPEDFEDIRFWRSGGATDEDIAKYKGTSVRHIKAIK
jgi:hypothetical protein